MDIIKIWVISNVQIAVSFNSAIATGQNDILNFWDC